MVFSPPSPFDIVSTSEFRRLPSLTRDLVPKLELVLAIGMKCRLFHIHESIEFDTCALSLIEKVFAVASVNRVGLDPTFSTAHIDAKIFRWIEVRHKAVVNEETDPRCVGPDEAVIIEIVEYFHDEATGWYDSIGEIA